MLTLRAFSSLHSGSASFCGLLLLVCIACGGCPTSPSSDLSGPPGSGGASFTGVQLTDDFGVSGDQARVPVIFTAYGSESNGFGGEVGDPIPPAAATQPNSVTGAMDSRWDNSELNPAFPGLRADDCDVVQPGWR